MKDWKQTLSGMLLGSLAYGAGMVLGSALTVWLISLVTLASISDASQMVRILVGLLALAWARSLGPSGRGFVPS